MKSASSSERKNESNRKFDNRQYDENKRGRVFQESSFQHCIQSTSLRPGRTDCDSGHTQFERVRQFGCADGAFGCTKLKHWHPISGFRKLLSNLVDEIQASASK